jgi:hypothetical protein
MLISFAIRLYTRHCYVDMYLQAVKFVLFIFRVTYKSFMGVMYIKLLCIMSCLNVSWPGTNRIPCEAGGFVCILHELKANGCRGTRFALSSCLTRPFIPLPL